MGHDSVCIPRQLQPTTLLVGTPYFGDCVLECYSGPAPLDTELTCLPFELFTWSRATPSVFLHTSSHVEIAGKAPTSYILDSSVHFSSVITSSTHAGLSVSAVCGVGCCEFPRWLSDLSLAVCLATSDLGFDLRTRMIVNSLPSTGRDDSRIA